MRFFIGILSLLLLPACSVFGDNGVESAPYNLIKSDETNNIEIRNYEKMILVSTSMAGDGRNDAFRKLFKYITGENQGRKEIAMTAPVFMDKEQVKGTEIAMTAPVFMNNNGNEAMMSFVMPSDFIIETTPEPNDPSVIVSEVQNYQVAAIRFNGTLGKSNVDKHTEKLREWLEKNGYTIAGPPVTAGYNGPLTLPMYRHNEVLIEVIQ